MFSSFLHEYMLELYNILSRGVYEEHVQKQG